MTFILVYYAVSVFGRLQTFYMMTVKVFAKSTEFFPILNHTADSSADSSAPTN